MNSATVVRWRVGSVSPASSPSTSRWSPSAASSSESIARASSAYITGAPDGAERSHSLRCGERKYGWLGSFHGLQ